MVKLKDTNKEKKTDKKTEVKRKKDCHMTTKHTNQTDKFCQKYGQRYIYHKVLIHKLPEK